VRHALLGLLLCAFLTCSCGSGGEGSSTGGGGSSTTPPEAPGANVLAFTVNSGPPGNAVDTPFATVKICAPGTSSCQSISGLVVDTGSYGLRLFASQITVNLPAETGSGGSTFVECAYFGSFTTWGPMKTASVSLGGEPAINVPVQIMNDPSFPAPSATQCGGTSPPAACQCLNSALNPTVATTVQQIGSNGILGVGVFTNDCGPACSTAPGSGTPGYYLCPASDVSGCSVAVIPENEQAQNPVGLLPKDNNGILIELPAIPAEGAENVAGSLIFGINTQSNNMLGNATLYTLPVTGQTAGELTTTYKGANYPGFLDTGSNGLFFPDSTIATCPSDAGFFCPPSTLPLSAVNTGANNASGTIVFDIANGTQLLDSTNTAFNDLGGPLAGVFDWGLPFFFGRSVFFGIAGQNPTLAGSNAFYAY
jgi:hypothetical protein